jgi:hypothetical protein
MPLTILNVIEYLNDLETSNEDRLLWGEKAIKRSVIDASINYCNNCLGTSNRFPDSVYPLPDGNIVMEWYEDRKLSSRLEIEGPFKATKTIRKDGQNSYQSVSWEQVREMQLS